MAVDAGLELIQRRLGDEVVGVSRIFYCLGAEVNRSVGPVELEFASGGVLRFDCGSNGERLKVSAHAGQDPFAEPLSDENRRFVETHGKWTRCTAPRDLRSPHGQVLDCVQPIWRRPEKLVGVVIEFDGAVSLTVEAAFDEVLVSTSSGGER